MPRLALATAPFCHAFPPEKQQSWNPLFASSKLVSDLRFSADHRPEILHTRQMKAHRTLHLPRGQQKLKLHQERNTGRNAKNNTVAPGPSAAIMNPNGVHRCDWWYPHPPPNRPPDAVPVPGPTGGVSFVCGLSYFTQPHSSKDYFQIERSLVLRRVLATEAVCYVLLRFVLGLRDRLQDGCCGRGLASELPRGYLRLCGPGRGFRPHFEQSVAVGVPFSREF